MSQQSQITKPATLEIHFHARDIRFDIKFRHAWFVGIAMALVKVLAGYLAVAP